jgi:mRNA interferase RelE/StbE
MAYHVKLRKRVLKALVSISEPYYANIKKAIYALEANPRPYGYRKLKGRSGYRIRVGDYRVIYEIFDAELVIDVVELGDRKDVYD